MAASSVPGSGATPINPTPFLRMYGPDLTGIFLGDTGALGVKAHATLRLVKFAAAQQFGSFAFTEDAHMVAAMSEIARQSLASECFGFDPYLLQLRMKFEGLAKDLKSLASVVKSGKSLLSGIKDAAKVAVAGRAFMEGVGFAMHVVVEGRDAADADSAMKKVREIATPQGKEIENSLPKLVRADPFQPTNRLLGPEGQRWVPIHAMVPHSRALPLIRAVDQYFNEHRDVVEKNGIEWGYLCGAVGPTAILIEPTFFWPDSHYEVHRRHIQPGHYAKLKQHPTNLEARNAMVKIRKDLARLFMEHGSAICRSAKCIPIARAAIRSPTLCCRRSRITSTRGT